MSCHHRKKQRYVLMPFFFLLARKKKSWDHISDINSHQRLREEKSVQCKQNEITLVAFIHFRMVASPTSQVENLPKTKALDVHLWAGLDPPRLAAVVYVSQSQLHDILTYRWVRNPHNCIVSCTEHKRLKYIPFMPAERPAWTPG